MNPHDTPDGSTFPFAMRKKDFMKVGGFDVDYPSPFVVDWDFFLKCELADMELVRVSKFNFYHFVSKSTKNRNGYIETPNERQKFFEGEKQAAEYFQYKWGFPPHRDKNNRCKQFIPL
jgi:GT2 family glycosyltransferase